MLAVVIPYYKLTFFEATLESLANQTDTHFKVYIGDDASPEDLSDLLMKYQGKFNFVYHRFNTNIGGVSLVKQWERCIAMAGDEEWIMILGDDDYMSENFVSEFYESYNLFHKSCNVVRYATKVIHQINGVQSELFINPSFETGIQFISRKINGNARGSLSELVLKKNEFLKYKFTNYPSGFYSDDQLVIHMTSTKRIFSINGATVFVRISSESLSGKAEINNDKLLLARFQFYEYLVKNKYHLLDTFTRKVVIERLLSYPYQFNKHDVSPFLNLYFKSILFLDFKFFLKISKKFIKIILGKSID